MKTLVTPEIFGKVKVVNHNCEADDLVRVGRTSRGNEVFVNPLVAGDRKVIVVSGTSHHLMSGYSGGRKSILPGVSGLETIRRNHIHSLAPDIPKSNPLIGMGMTECNPVHEDMVESARMVAPVFGVNIAVNAEGDICRIITGDFEKAWDESCRECRRDMGVAIREKADVVVVSCGGFPKDINLYQGCKALINAAQAVRDGGEIVFLARCQEGSGAPAFFNWIEPLRTGKLDDALRAEFTIDGYIFYAFCEAMAKCGVHMLTDIHPRELDGMRINVYGDIDALMRNVDFSEKSVYVMPFGGNTVPFL
jgi:nickel-dependent lactate racemase